VNSVLAGIESRRAVSPSGWLCELSRKLVIERGGRGCVNEA